ncbi:MAG: sodium:calcium symporter [Verrucomicrobiota bacterium]
MHQNQISNPWFYVILFLVASLLMIWRLESMSDNGVDGTVLGTVVMPYCSGLGNLIFAFLLGSKGGSGAELMINCLVNNVTNLTLLIGLPAMIWGMTIVPGKVAPTGKAKKRGGEKKGGSKIFQINRLSLLLTLTAVMFFTGAVWALASDGKIDRGDGFVLIGLFLFWQCFQIFDVLKNNVQQNKVFSWMLLVDLVLLGVGAYGIYVSINWLVDWLLQIKTGFVSAKNLGLLSGWLMVLPNALLAFYYGWTKRPEIIYTSQVGDGHICIPLCVGIFALGHSISLPPSFQTGMLVLFAATIVHFFFVAFLGRLPRIVGLFLTGSYGYFLYKGFLS